MGVVVAWVCWMGAAEAQGLLTQLGYGRNTEDKTFAGLGRAETNVTTKLGCLCLSNCDMTFDALSSWCYTSEPGHPPPTPCGYYSTDRKAYWDECLVNSTSSDEYLDTYDEIYSVIVNAAVPTGAIPFSLVGMAAAWPLVRMHGQWWALALPIVFGAWGALAVYAPISILAIAIAQIYLAMPYAPPVNATYVLGVALALPIVYYHLGRHIDPFRQVSGGRGWVAMS